MPEPEGRMAASEGTEKLRAVKKKKTTLKYQSFHLQIREKQRFCDHVGEVGWESYYLKSPGYDYWKPTQSQNWQVS